MKTSTVLFDLYFHNTIIVQNQQMPLICGIRNTIIAKNYPDCKTKGYKNYYSFFKIKFNNSNYKSIIKTKV